MSSFTQIRDHIGDLGPHPGEMDITCEYCYATFRLTRDMAYHFPVHVGNLYDNNFLLPCPFRPRTPSAITISSDYIPGQDHIRPDHTLIHHSLHSNHCPVPHLHQLHYLPVQKTSAVTSVLSPPTPHYWTTHKPHPSPFICTQHHLHAPIAYHPHPPHIPCFRAKPTHTDIKCSSILQAHHHQTYAHIQLLAHHLIWLTRVLLELPRPPEWQVLRTVVDNLTPTAASQ